MSLTNDKKVTATRNFECQLLQVPSHTQELSTNNRARKAENIAENESQVRLDPKNNVY